MLARRSPSEAYRRVDFDARVEASDPRQLVALCCEQVAASLGSALFAAARGDNALKSQSLTRALAALTALDLGVSGDDAMARALRQLYGAARRTVLDCALRFDASGIETIRRDFGEIGAALQAA